VSTNPSLTAEELLLENRVLALQVLASQYDLTDAASRRKSARQLSSLFFSLVKAAGVDLFVEAGAKEAAASRRAATKLGVPTVLAFEANPFTYEHFRADNDSVRNLEYRHTALSDASGSVTFNVLRDDDGAPRADGQSSLLKRQTHVDRGFVEVEVPATTLDEATNDIPGAAALWVDVEGATKPVLSGGKELLGRTAVAIVEVEDKRYWGDEQWLSRDVNAFMHAHGLLPVARDFQSRFQFNYLYVSGTLLQDARVNWLLPKYFSTAGGRAAPAAGEGAAEPGMRAKRGWRRIPGR
jgi:FkbM family methyltransferase